MKRTLSSSSVALALAGLLGTGVAFAQYNAPPAAPATAAPSAPAAAVVTPAAAPSGMAVTPNAAKGPAADHAVAPARTETATAAFGKLDMKHRGYVNNEDVAQLQGFNFKSADKNNDGKLDATEFNAGWTAYSGLTK
jgi:hypothetical protein